MPMSFYDCIMKWYAMITSEIRDDVTLFTQLLANLPDTWHVQIVLLVEASMR